MQGYRLTNFKAFDGTDRLSLRPVTLIYGANSSGKSSILQALLLLKQSIDEAETPETILVPKGNLVDLGSYVDFVHQHDSARRVSFELTFDARSLDTAPGVLRNLIELVDPPLLGVRLTFAPEREGLGVQLVALELLLGDDAEPIVSYSPQPRRGVPSSVSDTFLLSPHAAPLAGAAPILRGGRVNRHHRFWRIWWERYGTQLHGAIRRQITGSSEVTASMLNEYEQRMSSPRYRRDPVLEAFVLGMQESFRRIALLRRHFLSQPSYPFERALGHIDQVHRDAYAICRGVIPVECTSVSSDVNLLPIVREEFEKHAINVPVPDLTPVLVYLCLRLRQALEGMAYVGPLRESPERHYIFRGNVTEHVGKTGKTVPDVLFKRPGLIASVNRWLETLELNYQLSLSRLGADQGESDVFSLRLVDTQTNVSASVLDVGFGISQLLPIVVQSLLSRDRLVCIEQPEIHLHPRLQAILGALFCEASRSPYNNRFLIETHSEHIMLRLQRLIRSGQLPSSDVSVLYVDRGPGGSSCIELRLNERGDFIDRWPGGFFEESYREMFDFAAGEG